MAEAVVACAEEEERCELCLRAVVVLPEERQLLLGYVDAFLVEAVFAMGVELHPEEDVDEVVGLCLR